MEALNGMGIKKNLIKVMIFLLSLTPTRDPNLKKNDKGENDLHIASNNNHHNLVKHIIAHGVDPNLTNEKGETPPAPTSGPHIKDPESG